MSVWFCDRDPKFMSHVIAVAYTTPCFEAPALLLEIKNNYADDPMYDGMQGEMFVRGEFYSKICSAIASSTPSSLEFVAKYMTDDDKEVKDLALSDIEHIKSLYGDKKRPPFRFSMIGLKEGDVVCHYREPDVRPIIANDRQVEYNGNLYSLNQLAEEYDLFHQRMLPGPYYFRTEDGKNLLAMRYEAERKMTELPTKAKKKKEIER